MHNEMTLDSVVVEDGVKPTSVELPPMQSESSVEVMSPQSEHHSASRNRAGTSPKNMILPIVFALFWLVLVLAGGYLQFSSFL